MESPNQSKEMQTIANLSVWSENAKAPSASITYGASQNDFLRAIVLSNIRPIRVLADRDIAAEVALCANEELVAVPGIVMSRGLRGDLEALLSGADGPLTVVPYALIHASVKARSKRLSQDMDIIAGYAPPTDLVIHCVVTDLRDLLMAVMERGRSPVAIHDLLGVMPAIDHPRIVYFSDPVEGSVPAENVEIEPAERQLSYRSEDDPVDIDLVRNHAEFVADSDPADLRRMCPALADKSSAPLRAEWLQNFARLEDDEFSGWLRGRAERILKQAFGDTSAD